MNRFWVVLICLTVGACGIKPGSVKAPDEGQTQFPRTYPDVSTDPQAHKVKES